MAQGQDLGSRKAEGVSVAASTATKSIGIIHEGGEIILITWTSARTAISIAVMGAIIRIWH